MRKMCLLLAGIAAFAPVIFAKEFHVAITGDDDGDGTPNRPLRTIQQAAERAQPGDTITVHEGVYRERVNPPRGGESDTKRIVYRAAPGAKVEIKGSEIVRGWTRVTGDVWTVTLPNSFFGDFNPFHDRLRGDWFRDRGRVHHTGAVYLNGVWLVEAAAMDAGHTFWTHASPGPQKSGVLLNIAALRPLGGGAIAATNHAAQQGVKNAPCSEGGECVGWIEAGDWIRYDGVDFGAASAAIEFRAASATDGGLIEFRLDGPEGALLGTYRVPNTAGWQTWQSFTAAIKPMGGTRTLCLTFKTPPEPDGHWFSRVDETNTTLWAQFKGVDPNEQLVEVNVRRTVFYPDRPGRNYITVRGFALRHAATPWAPPTAEQIGLIGTHWSKGWVIEDNTISHSICSGVALGKYGDEFDNQSQSADAYNQTIRRALTNGWDRTRVGSHIVRNNHISHCEQTGIVGSLGCAFSTVTGNTIHDIHVRKLFDGAEMAGIKFHGAIDVEISGNRIYRTVRGLWLDWMAQGARVTGNLFHDNQRDDLFFEVNHGPLLVDNNLLLSPVNLLDMSEGGAFAHNLFAGMLVSAEEPGRETPHHPAHTTAIAGLKNITGSDNRFYNNIFIGKGETPSEPPAELNRHRRHKGHGLWVYNARALPQETGGNVYLNGARPYANEINPVVLPQPDPEVRIENDCLRLTLDPAALKAKTLRVTTRLLGKAKIPDAAFENPDGSPLAIDTDYTGRPRNKAHPTPGPFENPGHGPLVLNVWPIGK